MGILLAESILEFVLKHTQPLTMAYFIQKSIRNVAIFEDAKHGWMCGVVRHAALVTLPRIIFLSCTAFVNECPN